MKSINTWSGFFELSIHENEIYLYMEWFLRTKMKSIYTWSGFLEQK